MAQYHPCNRAEDYPEIARRIAKMEYSDALNYARYMGLLRATDH
jgi:putative pyruvate formate lyase activating enzyme